MKYSAAIAVLAAAGVYADLATVQKVLTSVGTAIGELKTAADGFNGDVSSVKSKADGLVSAIKDGKTTVDGSDDLTLTDALGLQSPVQDLTKQGQSLADAFKAKRSEVEKAGACGTVRTELSDINSNSQALIKAVVGKVPKDAQTIAETLAAGLTKVLSQAQDDFSESNCKDSSSPSGSSSGAATQTSAAPTTLGSVTGSVPATTATATGTGAPTVTVAPTGNGTSTGTPPPVTAGASFLAPAGALVMAVAAALL